MLQFKIITESHISYQMKLWERQGVLANDQSWGSFFRNSHLDNHLSAKILSIASSADRLTIVRRERHLRTLQLYNPSNTKLLIAKGWGEAGNCSRVI